MENQDRTVLARFFAGLVIVIVIVVLVWLFFFRHSDKKTDKVPTSKTNPSQSQTAAQDSSKAATAKPNTSTGGQTKAAELADTGPGQSAAIFVIATIGGTVAHYVYRRKTRQA